MVLLVAINSKYIHSMPSVYYLKEYAGGDISVLNLNINMPFDYMLKKACQYNPGIIGFSCYIFNIEAVVRLAEALRKIFPGAKIIFGGPEAGYNKKLLPYADKIFIGEGEEAFKEYIKNSDMTEGKYIECGEFDMDRLPDIYKGEYLNECRDKILYYESSRGCPFKCSYCMSASTKKVRYRNLERVFSDIEKIYGSGIKQIKFVDRTFNSSIERAEKIFSHIIENYNGKGINFHFEMEPDLFSEKMFEILAGAEKGLMQFETGVQTFNTKSLKAICRNTDINRAEENIKRLAELKNIHIHADLIAGLPLEDYNSFKQSFNRLYRIKPHCIQLGFLKVLKGSPLEKAAADFGIVCSEFPPYEILFSDFITANELCLLKDIREALDRYYNSGKFIQSVDYIENYFSEPFEMYEKFCSYLNGQGFFDRGISYNGMNACLYAFGILSGAEKSTLFNLLKSDFNNNNNNMNLIPFFKNSTPENNPSL